MDTTDRFENSAPAALPLSRRRFLQGTASAAAAAGLAGVAAPEAFAQPATASGATLSFTAATNGAASLAPAGDRLIAEIQNVLWSLPRKGGDAVALTPAGLEPTRPVHSPTAAGSPSAPTAAAASICGRCAPTAPASGSSPTARGTTGAPPGRRTAPGSPSPRSAAATR